MRKSIVLMALGVLAALPASGQTPARGEPGSPGKPAFQQGFENDGAQPIRVAGTNAQYQIHQLASVADLTASEGKRSLGIEITLESGTYLYLRTPMRLRPQGPLAIQARLRRNGVWPEGVQVAVGISFADPTRGSRGSLIQSRPAPLAAEGWTLVKTDLDRLAKASDTAETETWGIFITGKFAGQRLSFSVDDVQLQGSAAAVGEKAAASANPHPKDRVSVGKPAVVPPAIPLPAETVFIQNFEKSEAKPAKLWSTNATYELHQLQIVDDPHAADGTHSLKLDVTLKSGTFFYIEGPMRARPDGSLVLSGAVRLDTACPKGVKVSFGAAYDDPGTGAKGNVVRGHPVVATTEKWSPLRADLSWVSEVSETAHVRGWAIQIVGKFNGERLTISLDDIQLRGKVITDLDRHVGAWQEQHREQTKKRAQDLRRRGDEALLALPARPPARVKGSSSQPYAARVLAAIAARRDEIEREMRSLPLDGTATPAQCRLAATDIEELRHLAGLQSDLASYRGSDGAPFAVYDCSRISDPRGASAPVPLGGRLRPLLELSACPGEYEPLSFLLHALKPIAGMTVSVSPLKLTGGTKTAPEIPATAWDSRIVKVWWQAGEALNDVSHPRLVPELLLHDDGFVRRDDTRRRNTLRDPLAPRDTPTLQPVDITADGSQQWWLTVHVPATAVSGVYEGRVRLAWRGGKLDVPVRLKVWPFTLSKPILDYAIFYRGRLDGGKSIGSESKTPAQYELEMRDLLAHGISLPSLYAPAPIDADTRERDFRELEETLAVRRRAGVTEGPVPFLSSAPLFHRFVRAVQDQDVAQQEKAHAELTRTTADIAHWLAKRGYPAVAYYAIDEATPDILKVERPLLDAIRAAGGQTVVACSAGFTSAVGDALDIAIVSGGKGDPLRDLRAQRAAGKKSWRYHDPLLGEEKPAAYRRQYGLALWKSGYDGCCNYAYQHATGAIYDDFDSPRYRDCAMTYPTVDGVIPTLQWEGWREGVDDVRYLSTLLDAIRSARERAPSNPQVAEAEAFLTRLDVEGDLDTLRGEIARWIVALRGRN